MPRPLEGPPPKLQTPAGVVDTHIHFFFSPYEGQPGGPPPPEDATIEDYAVVQRRLGLDRAVIVQPGAYQLDNRCTLDALARMGEKARAIVCITEDTPEEELDRLTDLGVRGARFMNLPGGAVKFDRLIAVNERIQPFGWHPILQFDGREILQYLEIFKQIEGNYIIDHAGKFLEPVSPESAEFRALLDLVDRGNCFVKISACYETSRTGAPGYADVGALSKRLIAHAPDRMLWASNWPHVGVPRHAYPDDAELLDVLLEWAPDEAVRKAILVDNPLKLYDFA